MKKRIRSCCLDDPPKLQTGFFQSTPDKWMAGLSLKPSREGLPKSVLQSLVTLYTGKSFFVSSLNSYPCVLPATTSHPRQKKKPWTLRVVLKGKGSLKCGERHPCLIDICGRCAIMIWFYAWVSYVAESIKCSEIILLIYSYTISKSLRSFLSFLNHF